MGEDCQLDSDCPGSQVCFVANKSWTNVTQCHCNTFYGFSGPDCAHILHEPNGIFIFTVGMIGVPVSLAFTLVAAHNVYHLFQSARHKRSLVTDAVFLSSLYFTLAGLFFVVYCSLMVSLPLEPFQARHPGDDSTMYRETVMQIFLTLGLMLIAFGIITISSGFLEMTFVLSARRRRIIRWTLVIYKVSFAIIILTLVSSRMLFLAYAVAFPYIIILAVAYTVGLTILTNKIKRHRAAHVIDARKSDPAYKALQSAQNSIRFLCLALAAEIGLAIFWLAVCYFIGWRYLTPPGSLSPTMSGQLLWLPAVLAGCAVMKDLSQWRRIRVARISGLGQLTPKNTRSKFALITKSTPSLPPAPQVVSELIPVTADENDEEDVEERKMITTKLSAQMRHHLISSSQVGGGFGVTSSNVGSSQSPMTSGEQPPFVVLTRGSSPDNNMVPTMPSSPAIRSIYSQEPYEGEDGADVQQQNQQKQNHEHRVAVMSEDIKSSGSSSYETKEDHEPSVVNPSSQRKKEDKLNLTSKKTGIETKQQQLDLV